MKRKDVSYKPRMKRFTINIPVKKDGAFDLVTQKKISSLYFSIQDEKEKLNEIKIKLDDAFSRYVNS